MVGEGAIVYSRITFREFLDDQIIMLQDIAKREAEECGHGGKVLHRKFIQMGLRDWVRMCWYVE